MFTDIAAAIEEARWLKQESGGRIDYSVMQFESEMEVFHSLMDGIRVMYTTANDNFHTARRH